MFEVPAYHRAPANDERVVPTTLASISIATFGKLAIQVGGEKVLAAGAVAVVKAVQEADTVQREGSCVIKSLVQDAMEKDPQRKDKVCKPLTSAVQSRLHRYAHNPPQVALVHIAHVDETPN